MRQLKYTHGWTRRYFLEQLAKGIVTAGVLAPLIDVIGRHGEALAAYPDELRSIEVYTKGKLKPGQTLDANNADEVKELLDPSSYLQFKQEGRVADLEESTNNVEELLPKDYLEATLRNRGRATFDSSGNVVTREGKPWIGGNPFPDPKTAKEVIISNTLSWGRHDVSFYPIDGWVLDAAGTELYHYRFAFIEYQTVARVTIDPKPYLPGYENKLRYQPSFGLYPVQQQGLGFLQIWPYDQRKLPALYSYLPIFKRVRTLPNDQRFESLFPGFTAYISDVWATGDPALTWGKFEIASRGPMLAFINHTWAGDDPNWSHKSVGGHTGKKFTRASMELIPEAIAVDLYPVDYPRAPYSKKRVWFDARTMVPVQMLAFDRQGKPWKTFGGGFSIYRMKSGQQWPESGTPYWSWTFAESYDLQNHYTSRIEQVKQLPGGWSARVNDPKVFSSYCNVEALERLGEA